jgi:pyridoxal phosphate enzyme (YggS family)
VTVDPATVRDRIEEVRARLARAAAPVELVAVTKGFGVDAIEAAVAAGCVRIGENYAQELQAKWASGGAESGAVVHFIGRLQSNKIRQLGEIVAVWESIDRRSLLDELARRAPGATVLVQVNATGEPDKGGCAPGEAAALVEHGRTLNLNVDGMMTVGPTSGDLAATAAAFGIVRRLVDQAGLATCSMGMSHDLDVAIDQGSTRVRVGTAIFGARR